MFRSYKTEGIVLKRKNFGETDKLVTLYTHKHGKIQVIAKGIRKINSRKAPHLEVFSHLQMFISQGKSIDYIIEVQPLGTFSFLRLHIERIAYAFRIVEEVDRLCAEREVHQNVFELLLNILNNLNDRKITDFAKESDTFTNQLLWELGFLPKDKTLSDSILEKFLEDVMERNLKSKSLLLKI